MLGHIFHTSLTKWHTDPRIVGHEGVGEGNWLAVVGTATPDVQVISVRTGSVT